MAVFVVFPSKICVFIIMFGAKCSLFFMMRKCQLDCMNSIVVRPKLFTKVGSFSVYIWVISADLKLSG